MPRISHVLAGALLAGLVSYGVAVPPEAGQEKAQPAPEAEQAATRATLPAGFTAKVWAAEPLLANPVAFAFDEQGKCYVAETFRHSHGVTDTRSHMQWLEDDIAAQTVEDRVRKYEKFKYTGFEKYSERLRLIVDRTGNGVADTSEVFADGYNRPEDGIAAGVLARQGSVYFGCIPDLYKFDAKTRKQESLATGFGIHTQFIGHDLHGLTMGPDGKLYMSIGDRGLNITTREGKHLFYPDTGCVLRCDPDGANLEVIHTGLRNPQELVFDDAGNLFTYDNNSDSGDQCRWVHIVEGGDSGWRCGYQYGTLMHHPGVPQGNRGPWNTEKIWYANPNDPPAYIVPALKNFGNGPSGLTYYPGIGFDPKYQGHFFACDFTANPGNSKIWTLTLKPKGASFEVDKLETFVSNLVPTDCDFGPDGAFYWLDWIGGWNKPAKGRIFRVTHGEGMKDPRVAEAQSLIAGGIAQKTDKELLALFAFPHRQVRQEAQYRLAELWGKSPEATKAGIAQLIELAKSSPEKHVRMHAIWAAGMLGRKEPGSLKGLLALASHSESDVRVQAVKTLAIHGQADEATVKSVAQQFQDADLRVRFAAVETYSKLIKPEGSAAYYPVFNVLKANDDQDKYLRHACVMALVRMTEQPCDLFTAFEAEPEFNTPAVRMGLVLALRRLQCRRIGEFLNDADPRIVAEAARAIYDADIGSAMDSLAAKADAGGLEDPVAYRSLAANFKLGSPEAAKRVAAFAARSGNADHLRIAALKLLAEWTQPRRLDPITGLRQALPERPLADVVTAVRPNLTGLFAGSDALRSEAVKTVAVLGIADVGPIMLDLVKDPSRPARVRAEALFALQSLKAKELDNATSLALESTEDRLRAAARVVRAQANPTAAMQELPKFLADGQASVIEKQLALETLAGMPESREVDAALAVWLDKLLNGSAPAELQLDIFEAAQTRATARKLKTYTPYRELLQQYDQKVRAKAGMNMALRFPETLSGGDAERGQRIFIENAAVYCQRCHKVGGQGGDVGPVLDGIGAQKTRDYLLESIVVPDAQIAEGYKSVILETVDGQAISGVLRAKDQKQYTLITADNKVLNIPVEDVEAERPDKSAMPDDLYKKLSRRDLRDVVEYLASLKAPAKP